MRKYIVTILLVCGFLVLEAQTQKSGKFDQKAFDSAVIPVKEETEFYINPYYEEINTLEDVIEWISEDVWNEQMTKEVGNLYILNIEQVLKVLRKTAPVTYKQYQYIE